jgi:hypothetical protein
MKHIFPLILIFTLISCSENSSNPLETSTIGSETSIEDQIELQSLESINEDNKPTPSLINELKHIGDSVIDNNQEEKTSNSVEESSKKTVDDISITNFHEYVNYNAFLNQHVSSSGKVNYTLAKSNMADLDKIINEFQRNLPESNWTKNQKLAYWINAYNLFTIKLVASNYPVSSIKDITAKPWDKVFIELGEKKLSLNDIEHKEIRAKFNEPRIHFALNCASESCPKLLNRAYKASSLNSQLTQSTKTFLNDKSKNDLSDVNSIKVSQLFDWYKTDFDKDGDIIVFINTYVSTPFDKPKISYLDYSWKLNN